MQGDRFGYRAGEFDSVHGGQLEADRHAGAARLDLADGRPRRLQAVPLKLEYCYTRRATGTDARWITNRFQRACAAFGHDVSVVDGRLTITW